MLPWPWILLTKFKFKFTVFRRASVSPALPGNQKTEAKRVLIIALSSPFSFSSQLTLPSAELWNVIQRPELIYSPLPTSPALSPINKHAILRLDKSVLPRYYHSALQPGCWEKRGFRIQRQQTHPSKGDGEGVQKSWEGSERSPNPDGGQGSGFSWKTRYFRWVWKEE